MKKAQYTKYIPVESPLYVHSYVGVAAMGSCFNVCPGMLTLSVTNPVWVVKTRLCLANTASVPVHKRYSGLIDGLAKLYWHEGLRGLYRGFIPGLWGTSHGAIQFMFYEEFKKAYADYHSIPIDSKLVCVSSDQLCFYECLFVFRDHLLMLLWLLPANFWPSLSPTHIK